MNRPEQKPRRHVTSRKDTAGRAPFRMSCFDLLWLFINLQPARKQTVSAARLAEVPDDALIVRTDNEDGSSTFEISGSVQSAPAAASEESQ